MSFIPSRLLNDTIQLAPASQVLFLNSAADPFVATAAGQLGTGTITLAEDNIAFLHRTIAAVQPISTNLRHVAFHEYISREPAATIDVAILNLLYQPNNIWILYALQVAAHALKTGATLYVVGAKDRGILTIATRMREYFGNSETLAISKGYRVICSRRNKRVNTTAAWLAPGTVPYDLLPLVFAEGQLDEGTRLLLDALQVSSTDEALDIGCGVGYLGLHIAQLASKGSVTMLDVSLAAVAAAQHRVAASGLTNIRVLPSDGAQAVAAQRFDLVVTNPPFHHGGIQTTETAQRFIREAASVLRSPGRFYLVANRFLKYEPALQTQFKTVEEVAGNTRYKVLRALR